MRQSARTAHHDLHSVARNFCSHGIIFVHTNQPTANCQLPTANCPHTALRFLCDANLHMRTRQEMPDANTAMMSSCSMHGGSAGHAVPSLKSCPLMMAALLQQAA